MLLTDWVGRRRLVTDRSTQTEWHAGRRHRPPTDRTCNATVAVPLNTEMAKSDYICRSRCIWGTRIAVYGTASVILRCNKIRPPAKIKIIILNLFQTPDLVLLFCLRDISAFSRIEMHSRDIALYKFSILFCFYARQHVMLSASLLRHRRPSVCLSVTLLYCVKTTQPRIMKSSLWVTARTLVSNEVILVPLGEDSPGTRASKRGAPPLRNRCFTTIGSSSVKTVANRHRLAAYHNKHCRRAFQWYQHRWHWTTSNPQNRGF